MDYGNAFNAFSAPEDEPYPSRRQIQNRALSGYDPTPQGQQVLNALKPGQDARGEQMAVISALIASGMAPQAAAALIAGRVMSDNPNGGVSGALGALGAGLLTRGVGQGMRYSNTVPHAPTGVGAMAAGMGLFGAGINQMEPQRMPPMQGRYSEYGE